MKLEPVKFGDGYLVYPDGRIWREEFISTRGDGWKRVYKSQWVPTRISNNNKGNGGGYMSVDLRFNGKPTTFLHHRIVAKCFIPNPKNLSDVNHKDGDRSNNHKDNLEWVSRSDNQKHAYKYLRTDIADKHHKGVLTPEQAVELFYKRNIDKVSIKELASIYKITTSRVDAVARGRHSATRELADLSVSFKKLISDEVKKLVLLDREKGMSIRALAEKHRISTYSVHKIIKTKKEAPNAEQSRI